MATIIETVIALWNKGVMPDRIAEELGMERDKVEAIIDEPENYKEKLVDFEYMWWKLKAEIASLNQQPIRSVVRPFVALGYMDFIEQQEKAKEEK